MAQAARQPATRPSAWTSYARPPPCAATAGLPVVAIGGITLDTAAAVIDAGATSVAVISDLLAGEPEARAGAYFSGCPADRTYNPR